MSKPSMTLNQEHHGIELKFENKPTAAVLSQIKEQGFRWHREKKIWYGKDTVSRREFAEKLCGIGEQEKAVKSAEKPAQENSLKAEEPSQRVPNTFAAHYDKIGDAVILKDADTDLLSYMEAYCEKEQLYFRRTYGGDSLYITDLSNAQKAGKNCETWSLYPTIDADRSVSFLSRLRNAGAETIGQLYELCRSGKEIEDVSVSRRDGAKGVDVFSPFAEVKPLKEFPEKWTKRNFTQALMSGQLFRGEVAYRYTDDYAYDAAYDFGTGRGLDMASFAKSEVGEWGSCTSCYSKSGALPDKTGAYEVSYSEHSNSCKTLYFDVNCDIAEGKRRAKQRESALQNYNKMMEASCIEVSQDEIDPAKVYHVVELDKNCNTGAYGSKESNLQGEVLRDRLDPDCRFINLLSVEEMEIAPDLLYSVADFHNRMYSEGTPDKRVIPAGNWEYIVTGKALLELTAEGRVFPHITPSTEFGPSFEQAYNRLSRFADGTIQYMGCPDKTDYKASMAALITEYRRAGGVVSTELLPEREEKGQDEINDTCLSAVLDEEFYEHLDFDTAKQVILHIQRYPDDPLPGALGQDLVEALAKADPRAFNKSPHSLGAWLLEDYNKQLPREEKVLRFDDILHSAQKRQANQQHSFSEKSGLLDFDRQ